MQYRALPRNRRARRVASRDVAQRVLDLLFRGNERLGAGRPLQRRTLWFHLRILCAAGERESYAEHTDQRAHAGASQLSRIGALRPPRTTGRSVDEPRSKHRAEQCAKSEIDKVDHCGSRIWCASYIGLWSHMVAAGIGHPEIEHTRKSSRKAP